MKYLSLIIALLITPLVETNVELDHEYYVSVTKIEYAQEQNSLQIISQIFIDDFETLLRKRYDENITLDSNKESQLIEDYMNRYLQNKLKIRVNGAAVKFKFIGKEYKEDITYCYLEIENVNDLNSIEVTNRILFDILPEQQNIVRLKMKKRNKSFLLIPDNDKCVLNFN
ncbi:MAG: peptidase E [Winogradskyella sp.]|uniref:DUF6702 family protein n=1 Tax=Winogradskyella sp. TaxID=1883156 RepID=UPI00185D7758|nr:peptidase E [Winogradskyella sp.]